MKNYSYEDICPALLSKAESIMSHIVDYNKKEQIYIDLSEKLAKTDGDQSIISVLVEKFHAVGNELSLIRKSLAKIAPEMATFIMESQNKFEREVYINDIFSLKFPFYFPKIEQDFRQLTTELFN